MKEKNIVKIRKDNKLTQDDLAEKYTNAQTTFDSIERYFCGSCP